jgi:hypothetical protein
MNIHVCFKILSAQRGEFNFFKVLALSLERVVMKGMRSVYYI